MTILWDWNGTLFDDTDAAIGALNDQLVCRGLKPITREYYRAHFAFPVRSFYAQVGMDLEHEDWNALAQGYHDAYHARPAQPNAEAVAALSLAREAGCRQAIVSALRQDYLDATVARFGLTDFFAALIGADNLDGGSKLARAQAFLLQDRAAHGARERYVLIGDALHDAEVAEALGIGCVLFSGGSHAGERLARVAPTEDTLLACIRRALTEFVV